MKFVIDAMRSGDWEQVRTIYVEGIATRNATFETVAPSWVLDRTTSSAELLPV